MADVLNATERLLRVRHFDELAMEDIAKEAGLQIGSLYHFFEDKAAVLVSVLERVLEAEADAFRAAPEDASRSLPVYLRGLELRQRQLWKPKLSLLSLYFAYQRHPRIWTSVLQHRAHVATAIATKLRQLYPTLKPTAAMEVGEQIGITITVLNDNLAYVDERAQRRLRRECFEMLIAYVESKSGV